MNHFLAVNITNNFNANTLNMSLLRSQILLTWGIKHNPAMMKEANALHNVALFHKTFKHPIVENPTIPDAIRCDLRVSLLQEELNELKAAIHESDLVEIADALCDLQYVLSGAVLEFGFSSRFSDLFEEVQRSNMSKACKSMQEAEATCTFYKEKGTDAYFKKEDGLFLVYRRSDNKTLKSINYSPANLNRIIQD